jgi:hypothetical protein
MCFPFFCDDFWSRLADAISQANPPDMGVTMEAVGGGQFDLLDTGF